MILSIQFWFPNVAPSDALDNPTCWTAPFFYEVHDVLSCYCCSLLALGSQQKETSTTVPGTLDMKGGYEMPSLSRHELVLVKLKKHKNQGNAILLETSCIPSHFRIWWCALLTSCLLGNRIETLISWFLTPAQLEICFWRHLRLSQLWNDLKRASTPLCAFPLTLNVQVNSNPAWAVRNPRPLSEQVPVCINRQLA